MLDDAELLRRYAATRSEGDFAELVRRHVNLVYSAALRQVNGDAPLAQDVTQEVFTDLVRKAAVVSQHRVLAAWLFTSTRFAAAKAVRGERRRQAREAEAHLMQELNRDPAALLDWARVRPVLDDVLSELTELDREAILLRFFEGRDFASVGEKLNTSDNTARMRVERALDKLRALLERRGVKSTSAALAVALANQAVVAAPMGLAATVTGAALAGGMAVVGATAGGAAAAGGTAAWINFMSMTKLQVGLGSALAVAGATGFVVQANSNAQLREDLARLHEQAAATAALRAENLRLASTTAEVTELRKDDAALAELRDEAAALQKRLQVLAAANAAGLQSNPQGVATGAVLELKRLDQAPRPTFQARPVYPAELRRAGIEGQVVVDFVIDRQGVVQNAFAVRSSQREFEAAAIEAVSLWTFEPGQKGGQAVNTHMQVPMVFTIAKSPAASAGEPATVASPVAPANASGTTSPGSSAPRGTVVLSPFTVQANGTVPPPKETPSPKATPPAPWF